MLMEDVPDSSTSCLCPGSVLAATVFAVNDIWASISLCPSICIICHDSGCAAEVTYELPDASPCKATEAGQVALGAKFDGGLALILEDLHMISARLRLEAAVNGRLHQCREPSYWRLIYSLNKVKGETRRTGLCGLWACGSVAEKGMAGVVARGSTPGASMRLMVSGTSLWRR
jgi:hypothetical protein